MSGTDNLMAAFEALPKWAKIILVIFGMSMGPLYRILRFVETKNIMTLIWAILFFIPFVMFIPWVIDLVTVIKDGKVSFFVD